MRYLSVCSGIEAATVAWHPLGWEPVAFSEIEKFPSQVLAHHYPSVPNWGDMTKFQEWPDANVDVLVGGTPCQSFSVAGLRKGLADPRGNLMLTYLAIAAKYCPEWLVWENVPGVLSSNRGRDFGALLGGLAELGYGFAYRILDAQYFGVAQRRRRVFVVGCLGDWRRAAAVLFERASLSGNPAPSREAGQNAPTLPSRSTAGGGPGTDFDCDGGLIQWPATVAPTLNAAFGCKQGLEDQHALGGGGLFVPVAFHNRQDPDLSGDVTHPLGAKDNGMAVAFAQNQRDEVRTIRVQAQPTHSAMQVRRLTPTEAEFLQGFPRSYTDIRPNGKPTPDGPRYKALGNSMAVPVMAWIGKRIAEVSVIPKTSEEAV